MAPQKSNESVRSLYFDAIYKPFNLGIGTHIFFGIFFGTAGTLAFGLYGTIFYFLLMVTGIAIKCKATECIKQNKEDIRLFVYSIITFLF